MHKVYSESIITFKDFREWLRCDLIQRGAISPTDKITLICIFKDPINVFMVLLRLNELSRNSENFFILRLLIRFLFRRHSVKLSFSIPPNVFGPGLAIVHYGPIIVNGNARVGKNCRIHVGVNIGASGKLTTIDDAKLESPVIGDNVYIGPGAKIYGPITIGSFIAIGANSVVNRSFEADAITIAGIPAKIISELGSEGMIISNL